MAGIVLAIGAVALACSGETADQAANDASDADSGSEIDASHLDSGAAADASHDAGAATHDAASPADVCATCLSSRCAGDAVSCHGSLSCSALASCIEQCTDQACATACASTDSADVAAADALLECTEPGGQCALACDPTLSPQTCAAQGSACDTLVLGYGCCSGAGNCTYTPNHDPASLCCNPPGGSCDPSSGSAEGSSQCCASGKIPGVCTAGGTCALLTCVATDSTECYTGLGCCDSRLACSGGGLAGPTCCAATGAKLATGEGNLCCGHGSQDNGDGTITCLD